MVIIQSKFITFLVTFIVWNLLSWDWTPASFIVGALVSFVVALASGHLFSSYPTKWAEPRRYFYFMVYLGIFIWECFKSNVDVASRVIRPTPAINPGIVKVKTRLKTETGLTFLANSITLTPGTFTVDIDRDKGELYIHWIYVREKDPVRATKLIVAQFENVLAKVFE